MRQPVDFNNKNVPILLIVNVCFSVARCVRFENFMSDIWEDVLVHLICLQALHCLSSPC